jgi:mannose-6-phosphate isomerase-like protein (cupin superfamily)
MREDSMRTIATVCSFILMLSTSASMQAGRGAAPAAPRAPSNDNIATLLTANEIRAQLMKMTEDRPTQEHTVVERVGIWRLSIEHRKLPQRPALHQQEGEVWAVIEGTATIRTGGKIEGGAPPTAGTATQAPGNVFGKVIVGGTDHRVGPGDFLLVPENVPHEIVAAAPTLKFIVFEITRQK